MNKEALEAIEVAHLKGKRIVMTNGVYDVLHPGHVSHLTAAAAKGDFLVVAINSDKAVRALKGPSRPIHPVGDRITVLKSLRCVDVVFEFDQLRAEQAIEEVKPAVYVKGGDYTLCTLDATERATLERLGTEIVFTLPTPYSSTRTIAKTQYDTNATWLVQTVLASMDIFTEAMVDTTRTIVDCLGNGGKILTCGNGGSAADAMHFAQELTGRYLIDRKALPAVCLSADPCFMSCVANDSAFSKVYSRGVEALGRPGDVLVAFSTSGNSTNVIEAIDAAYIAGMTVILLTGNGGGRAAGRCLVNIVVPSTSTARIQEVHTLIFHTWLDAIDVAFK